MTWATDQLKQIETEQEEINNMNENAMATDSRVKPSRDRITVAQALDELHATIESTQEKTAGLARKIDPVLSQSNDASEKRGADPTDPNVSQVLASIMEAVNRVRILGYYVDDLYERTTL